MNKVFTIIMLVLSTSITAQIKSSSIGLRGGGVSGFSYKYIDDDFKAFELIFGWQEDGIRLIGMLEKYQQLATNRMANLFLFMGGGAHTGYVSYNTEYVYQSANGYDYYVMDKVTKPVLGADFIIGLEYRFETIPLRFGLDYKPYIQVFGENPFRVDLWDMGFSLRYELDIRK
jgi:hypothetical protein